MPFTILNKVYIFVVVIIQSLLNEVCKNLNNNLIVLLLIKNDTSCKSRP